VPHSSGWEQCHKQRSTPLNSAWVAALEATRWITCSDRQLYCVMRDDQRVTRHALMIVRRLRQYFFAVCTTPNFLRHSPCQRAWLPGGFSDIAIRWFHQANSSLVDMLSYSTIAPTPCPMPIARACIHPYLSFSTIPVGLTTKVSG